MIKFLLIFILTAITTWYICDGLLWIEFAMKPYTHIGRVINTWLSHSVLILASLIFAVALKGNRH